MHDIDAITQQLSALNFTKWNADDLENALSQLNPPVTPTKTLMKKIIARKNIFGCCCCVQTFDTIEQLAKHIKSKKHKLRQDHLGGMKRDLLYRVRDRLPNDLTLLAAGTEKRLNASEQNAYATIKDLNLSPGETTTLQNIVTLELHLKEIRAWLKNKNV